MRRIWLGALALVLAALAAIPAARADETYVLTPEVWSLYQKYLGRIKNGMRPGAYAITTDGTGAFYVWCEETQCMAGASYSTDAVNYCEREYNTECVTFAVRDNIRVQYRIAGAASSSSTAPELSPPPAPAPIVEATQPQAPAPEPAPQPETVAVVTPPKNLTPPPPAVKIAVTPAVKAEIDSYLENTQSSGKAWALAIARDGSDVGFASCPTSGGWSGGRACEPVRGGPQELASREAIMRCGGAAACTLLYEGAQKLGNIEIVTP